MKPPRTSALPLPRYFVHATNVTGTTAETPAPRRPESDRASRGPPPSSSRTSVRDGPLGTITWWVTTQAGRHQYQETDPDVGLTAAELTLWRHPPRPLPAGRGDQHSYAVGAEQVTFATQTSRRRSPVPLFGNRGSPDCSISEPIAHLWCRSAKPQHNVHTCVAVRSS